MVYPDDDELVLRYLPRSLECWVGSQSTIVRIIRNRKSQDEFVSRLVVEPYVHAISLFVPIGCGGWAIFMDVLNPAL